MVMSFSQYLKESKTDGSYVGIKISANSQEEIMRLIRKLKLPSSIKKEDIHITLIYSKKTISNSEWPLTIDETAIPTKLAWLGDDNNTLVVLLDSPYLIKRNKYITKKYGAISDYDKYTPHITLAYKINNYTIHNDIKLPREIKLVAEYYNDLENDWSDNK